ncbi:MAG: amidohydrolase [Hellea sp.]|nr:amidohydrolase [Hellea sp.]
MKTRITSIMLGSAVAILWAGSPAIAHTPENLSELPEAIAADYDDRLEDLYEHFHANPELSFVESKTAARMAEELRALGYDVTEGVGGTGVVAVLKNGDGPTVMMRADMDGLPVRENTGLKHASKVMQKDRNGDEFPVMHACGHDIHITSMVSSAKMMQDLKGEWSGTLVLIVQPAEEIIAGAKAMIEDGLFTRFPKPDYVIGFHVWANLAPGKIVMESGTVMSSSDSVYITVRGVGAHGASPHQGLDPIALGSSIVMNLQTIVTRNVAPLKPGIITVGTFHAGTKNNIIPHEAKLGLTVRSDDPETREKLLAGITRVTNNTAKAFGVPDDLMPIIDHAPNRTPPTINDAGVTAIVRAALEEDMGDHLTTVPREGMGAEDFAYLMAPETGVRGVYFSVGGSIEEDGSKSPSHHSPEFNVLPEPSITAGTEAMVRGAIALFDKG